MKYPRTYHLPSSHGATRDDKILSSLDSLIGNNVVITEKMDGENTTMCSDRIHARSETSVDHPSQHWVKGLHASIKHLIPKELCICGENLYAVHSIHYKSLRSYFLAFGVWNVESRVCLPWDQSVHLLSSLGLSIVPILYEGILTEDVIDDFTKMVLANQDTMEGFVIRNVDGFSYDDFKHNVAKFVREGHVQTDTHWKHRKITRNILL